MKFTDGQRFAPFSLRRLLGALIVVILSLGTTVPSIADVRIGSWNIQNLGWNNGKDYEALAEVAKHFDLLAIQEVMSADGIKRLKEKLEASTGEEWGLLYSHLIGRGSYQEKYAFLWRRSELEYLDGAVVYLDDRDAFAREPMSARFETTDGLRFVVATVHVLFGKSRVDRMGEINALSDYWLWLQELYPEDDAVFLTGDFNLTPQDSAWERLTRFAEPLITEGATTVSSIEGRFANLYDLIFVPRGVPLPIVESGIVNVPRMLGISHEEMRARVSDHVPVYVTLDPDHPPRVFGTLPSEHPSYEMSRLEWEQRFAQAANDNQPLAQDPLLDERPPVIGNKNSGIYHWPGCPGYETTALHNRRSFASNDEAEAEGFRAARNC